VWPGKNSTSSVLSPGLEGGKEGRESKGWERGKKKGVRQVAGAMGHRFPLISRTPPPKKTETLVAEGSRTASLPD